jgi:DNA-binding response OmpR family regulator
MKPRILIVEDEPGIADTLQYALRATLTSPLRDNSLHSRAVS